MIVRAKEINREEIISYIGTDIGKCLYLYMDLLKFSIEGDEISVWIEWREGDISAVMMKYHTGFHVFSKGKCDVGEMAGLILNEKPTMICGEANIIMELQRHLFGYKAEYGIVARLNSTNGCQDACCVRLARESDFMQIAKMLKEDEDYGASFTIEELENQFRARQAQKLGRSYVLTDHERVVAHVATGAECDDFATISGVVVAKDFRRKGLASIVLKHLCEKLIAEGKSVYSIHYAEASIALHKKVGFSKFCEWGKLFIVL